jgi:hypothetical protein
LADPLRLVARFHRPGFGIVGAGGIVVERWLLDVPGVIVAHGDARRRVLVGWPHASRDGEAVAGGAAGMWLDINQIDPA